MTPHATDDPTDGTVHHARIDDHLGPGPDRYLGGKFRRVARSLHGIRVTAEGEITATARLDVPEGDTAHFGTVDGLLFGLALARLCVRERAGVREHAGVRERGREDESALTRFRMRAGTDPLHEVDAIRVTGVVSTAPGSDGSAATTVDARFGPMDVEVTVTHAGGSTDPEAVSMAEETVWRAADPPVERDVDAENPPLLSDARLDLDAGTASLEIGGVDAVGPLDAVLAVAQLAQSFLYSRDDVDIAKRPVVWQRDIRLEVDGAPPPAPLHLDAELVRSRTVELDGTHWNTTDWRATAGPYRFRHRLAHEA